MKTKPGLIVTKVQIVKDDNINDENIDGYEIKLTFDNGKNITYIEYTINELEDKAYGIYEYDGENYIEIENWGFK